MSFQNASFYNAYRHGFVRVAAATTVTALGDPAANAAAVLEVARDCHDDGVALAVFPELTLSGYSLDDITVQDTLLTAVTAALETVLAGSADLLPVLIVGAPLVHRNRVYNTAVVIHRGVVLGVVPKSYLPGYREFYEPRQFAAGAGEHGTIRLGERDVPFGADLLFAAVDVPGFVTHVEICEDMFVPVPPSAPAALAGATVLANLSSSPVTIGRADERRLLARSASARCVAAYLYAAAGAGSPAPTWRGTARPGSSRTVPCSPKANGSPTGPAAASPTSMWRCYGRNGCGSTPSMTTGSIEAPNRSGASIFGCVPRRRSGSAPCRRAFPVRSRRSSTAATGLL